jgi:hypothetical protein
MITTLVLVGVALAISGVAYMWTSSYTTTQTAEVSEKAAPEVFESTQITGALQITSATLEGKIFVSNNGATDITIDRVVIDGDVVYITPVTIPAGGFIAIELNRPLSPGTVLGLMTTTGINTEITLTEEQMPQLTTGGELQSIVFRDLLDDTTHIDVSKTDATITGSEAALGSTTAPGATDWNALGDLNVSGNLP